MIEIVPKITKKSPSWLNIILYTSIILILISLASFLILNHLEKEASQIFQDLENALNQKRTSQGIALEEEVLDYQKKINNFSTLFNLHQFPLIFFPVLEELCHPKVEFTSFSLNPQGFQATFSGNTESFQTLGQQLIIFKMDTRIKDVDLSNLSLGKEGRIGFNLTLSLSPEIFK